MVGPSGSGKSSLLLCLSGIIRPTSGSVRLRGERIDSVDDSTLSRLRRETFGFVFQFGELVPELTLVENVALPLRFSGVARWKAEGSAGEMLRELGLGKLGDRRPAQVSGGEMQRASVARSLIHGPDVVFADEPTGALDSKTGAQVLALLFERTRDRGASLVVITHSEQVASHADSVVTMNDGRTDGGKAAPTAAVSSGSDP